MIIMAKRTDIPEDISYSSHVKKVYVLNSQGEPLGKATEVELIADDQQLTTSYATFGALINTAGYTNLLVYIDADVNSTETVDLKYTTYLDTSEYEINGLSATSLWTTGALDFKKLYSYDVSDLENVQLKAKATTLGVTAANLELGTTSTANYAAWVPITNGEFAITIDSDDYDITGLDFTDALDMDDVAEIIQTGIRAVTGKTETVVWDTNHFLITTTVLGIPGNVGYTSAVVDGEGTDISGATEATGGAAGTFYMDGISGEASITEGTGTIGTLTINIQLV